ncbi:MAG: DUF2281 domain-containing protein [Bacteriovoracaceae bacterium]|nr:DUF2281 domain-containing protein [Bacteriovoracaceae bacterium]
MAKVEWTEDAIEDLSKLRIGDWRVVYTIENFMEVKIMSIAVKYKENIVKELEELTPELIEEVVDFIEFLKTKRMEKTGINHSSLLLQQESLSSIWDNESEDLYEL